MDFAENYSCSAHDEAQSAYWTTEQVTIHPFMAFINSSDSSSAFTENEAVIIISNDLKHDSHAVHNFLLLNHNYLKETY